MKCIVNSLFGLNIFIIFLLILMISYLCYALKKYQMSYYFGALGRQKHYVETTLAQLNEMPTFIHNILNLSLWILNSSLPLSIVFVYDSPRIIDQFFDVFDFLPFIVNVYSDETIETQFTLIMIWTKRLLMFNFLGLFDTK